MQTIDKDFISFPTEEAHHQTHPIGVYVALVQEVHPQVISKIHELVLAGVSESIKMKHYFKHYVTNCLAKKVFQILTMIHTSLHLMTYAIT